MHLDWKLVAVTTILATAIAWSLAAVQPPQYRAVALAAITPTSDNLNPQEMLRGVEVLERRTVVATVAALASTQAVQNELGSGPYVLEAVVVPNTNLFRIVVEGDDGAQAAALANRIPPVLSRHAAAMFRFYRVTTVAPATTPTAPFLPRTGRALMSGLLIGLFLGLLTAYAARRRRTLATGPTEFVPG